MTPFDPDASHPFFLFFLFLLLFPPLLLLLDFWVYLYRYIEVISEFKYVEQFPFVGC